MELSYTAYNYPSGEELPDIPGDFMGDVDKPATTFLTEHGFENVRYYNYDHDESVAHVVAHKNIMFSSHESEQENTEGDNIDGLSYNDTRTYASNSNIVRLSDYIYNSSNIVTDNDTDSSDQGLFSSVTSVASSSEGTNTSDTRPLIVVDIRGSVTDDDWDNDFKTQFVPCDNKFEEMKDTIADNLESYISEISDPIILVTGHSLGAVIANLFAAQRYPTYRRCTYYSVPKY